MKRTRQELGFFYYLFQWLRSDLMVTGSTEHTSMDFDRKGNIGPGNRPL